MNTIVIKQSGDKKFFVATPDSIVIDIFGLSSILKFLLFSGMLSKRVLTGLIEEFDNLKEGE